MLSFAPSLVLAVTVMSLLSAGASAVLKKALVVALLGGFVGGVGLPVEGEVLPDGFDFDLDPRSRLAFLGLPLLRLNHAGSND